MAEPEINISVEQKLKVSLEEGWLQRVVLKTLKPKALLPKRRWDWSSPIVRQFRS